MVKIYYTYLSKDFHEKRFDKYLTRFPIKLIDKIKRLRKWEDAQANLLSKLLLSQALFDGDLNCLELINYSKYGRPYIMYCPDFNISHSGDIVVCAIIKNNDIGVDIEQVSKIEINDFVSVMTNLEMLNIQKSDNPIRKFYEYWTKKESLLKLQGTGISEEINSFEVLGNKVLFPDDKIYLKGISISDKYICHIATKKKMTDADIELIKIYF
jgi:4'-phosphopantetheinyl transferase